MKTQRLLLRPWERGDVDDLIELSKDPGCRTEWGIFAKPMGLPEAALWIDRATESMVLHRLGSWAVLAQNRMVGCLNLVHRHLDGDKEMLPTLELRFMQPCYENGMAGEALAAIVQYARQHLQMEQFHVILSDKDRANRRLVESTGMSLWKTARYEKKNVDIFSNRPRTGSGVTASPLAEAGAPLAGTGPSVVGAPG